MNNSDLFHFRVHQRSVEVARQRLEEYQQALQIRHNMTTRSLLSVSRPPTINTQPYAPPQLLSAPAVPSFIRTRHQTSQEVTVRGSEASASPPCPASSSSVCSELLLDEPVGFQRPGVNTQLTDDIMRRVTEHLPERLRASSGSEEQLPHKLSSTHKPISSQLSSDQLRAIGPSEGPHLGSREEDIHRLQEAQRRAREQREAEQQREAELREAELQRQKEAELQREAALQQQQRLLEEERRRNEVELVQMRRQKEALQALIDTDEQVGGRITAELEQVRSLDAFLLQQGSHTSCEQLEAEEVHQQRMKLLASLLKAIEESNGGSLSHLEEPEEHDAGTGKDVFCSL